MNQSANCKSEISKKILKLKKIFLFFAQEKKERIDYDLITLVLSP